MISGGCGGSSDGGTPPVTVASVLITAPVSAPSFATLGRTVQFSAVAKDAGGATIGTATITWSSSNPGAASVNGGGLVTAVASGTTSITAISGGVSSTGRPVTVSQVAVNMVITPGSVAFGAIGSSRQLSAAVTDSGGAQVVDGTLLTWSHAGGTAATVSPVGLVTAVAVGATDTAVASKSGLTAKAPISVTQVAATVTVSSTGIDTLKTTGSTKQYTAVVKDSNANTMGGATVSWSSSATGVATVNSGTGVATAVADGNANVTATSGSANGLKALTVRRYAKTFSLSPNTAQSITTQGTTIQFTGTAQDSSTANLAITWTSDNTAVITMVPASGTSPAISNATPHGNGSANVTMAGGTLSASVAVSVSGQSSAPMTAAVTVGDDFFKSGHNGSGSNIALAIDTVAAGGTVTWTWAGIASHNVTSGGSPTFTPSPSTTQSSGTFAVTFANPGTYQYFCSIHGGVGIPMAGTIVVR